LKKLYTIKIIVGFVGIVTTFISCVEKKGHASKPSQIPLVGTWQLLTGTLIEKGDTVVTGYTKNISFIKIINDTHFAFLQHDLKKGIDSVPVFASGGGSYSLSDSSYTEHLEYCSARDWEGHDFKFIIDIKNDTLIQSGVEIVESAGINRINIEKYIRVKK